MKFSIRRPVLRAALLVLILLLIPYFLLMAAATTKEFKRFAQQKASDYLGVDVQIGRIRISPFGKIILSNFQIESPTQEASGIEIGQIIFSYSIPQLLSRQYQVPSSIRIAAPKMTVGRNPFTLFQETSIQGEKKGISAFELAGGEIKYQIPGLGAEIILSEIAASFVPRKGKNWRGKVTAQVSGFLEGQLILKGELDPATGKRRLRGELRDASISNSFLEVSNKLTAKFLVVDQVLTITHFDLKTGRESASLTGKIENLFTQPKANLKLDVVTPERKLEFGVEADLEKETLTGRYQSAKEKLTYRSQLTYKDNRVQISKWLASDQAEGHAFLDFGKGEAGFHYERDKRRFDAAIKWKDPKFVAAVRVEHIDFQQMDIVMAGNFEMTPSDSSRLKFDTAFETDYFILDTVALDDLKGTFTLDSGGLKYLNSSWGKGFKGTGTLKWGSPMTADLTVRMENFDLNGLKHFADKPLPQEMGGFLSGKVTLKGAVIKPRLTGSLSIRKGWVGKVDFENAILQFSGYPPVLDLKDSHVYRGRGSLLITGKIDFEAQNMLRAVQFETQDHIVLYRGLDVTLTEEKGALDMEIHPGIPNVPAVGIKARGSDTKDEDVKDGNDRYFEVGPRFRF